jgi:hypothetical protein
MGVLGFPIERPRDDEHSTTKHLSLMTQAIESEDILLAARYREDRA